MAAVATKAFDSRSAAKHSRTTRAKPVDNPNKGNHTLESTLQDRIVFGLQENALPETKAWFTNYVKGSTWFGCKVPVVRSVVKQVVDDTENAGLNSVSSKTQTKTNPHLHLSDSHLESAIALLQRPECDAKLAGMVLLAEFTPIEALAKESVLQRLEEELFGREQHIADWSSADWFAMRVLKPLALHHDGRLAHQVLGMARRGVSLWHRRCGLVPFVGYRKLRHSLPKDFGKEFVSAAEAALLKSPEERFTQTGVAWTIRYVLEKPGKGDVSGQADAEAAMHFVQRHRDVWTTEAKKSLVEKLDKTDKRRTVILSF